MESKNGYLTLHKFMQHTKFRDGLQFVHDGSLLVHTNLFMTF